LYNWPKLQEIAWSRSFPLFQNPIQTQNWTFCKQVSKNKHAGLVVPNFESTSLP
jgi:hypothetical protein